MRGSGTPTAYDRATGSSPALRQGPHTPSRVVKRNNATAGSPLTHAELVQLTASVDNLGAPLGTSAAGGTGRHNTDHTPKEYSIREESSLPQESQPYRAPPAQHATSSQDTSAMYRSSGRRESVDSPYEDDFVDEDTDEGHTPIQKHLLSDSVHHVAHATATKTAEQSSSPARTVLTTEARAQPKDANSSEKQDSASAASPSKNGTPSKGNGGASDAPLQTSPSAVQGNLPPVHSRGGEGNESRGSERENKTTPPTRVNIGKKELIGVGSFGKVYRAMDLDTNRIIAVKEILIIQDQDSNSDAQKQIRKLEREVQVMQKLLHPNIVQYLGARRYDEFLHIYMEFVPGGTIASLLKTFGPLQEKQAAHFTRQILQGLSYLHHKKIAHRDLKGDNLFVDVDGTLKLGDFGTSKEIQSVHLTQSVTGTPYFMAPEVINCSGHNLDADIWSVGCCVIQMLTGKPPFYGADNHLAVMLQVSRGKMETQIPTDISDQAKEFIRCCTKQNPGERWSCDQLLVHPWMMLQAPQTPQTQRRGDSRGNVSGSGVTASASGGGGGESMLPEVSQRGGDNGGAGTGSRGGSANSNRGQRYGLPPRTPVKTPPDRTLQQRDQQAGAAAPRSPPPKGHTGSSSQTSKTPKKGGTAGSNLTTHSLRKDNKGNKAASTPKKSTA